MKIQMHQREGVHLQSPLLKEPLQVEVEQLPFLTRLLAGIVDRLQSKMLNPLTLTLLLR